MLKIIPLRLTTTGTAWLPALLKLLLILLLLEVYFTGLLDLGLLTGFLLDVWGLELLMVL